MSQKLLNKGTELPIIPSVTSNFQGKSALKISLHRLMVLIYYIIKSLIMWYFILIKESSKLLLSSSFNASDMLSSAYLQDYRPG